MDMILQLFFNFILIEYASIQLCFIERHGQDTLASPFPNKLNYNLSLWNIPQAISSKCAQYKSRPRISVPIVSSKFYITNINFTHHWKNIGIKLARILFVEL